MGVGVIDRYRARLPVGLATPALSLGEGSTPLIASRVIGERLGVELHFKFEGANPTGSFKDRGMVVAVAKALEAGARRIACASTGNTAASASAYAARAGIEAVVLCPAGAIAAAKEAQSRVVGGRVLGVRGSFDDALRVCLELAERDDFVHVNSVNPHRLEGQKTAAFELVEQLGGAPDLVALPFGGGGNTCAYARGFAEEGASTRLVPAEARERATTLASAIRITEPAHADEVAALVEEGRAEVVTLEEREISAAWHELALREGIFCEPASAAGVAALSHLELEPGSRVVCVLTGHGLKDVGAVEAIAAPATVIEPTVQAVLEEVER